MGCGSLSLAVAFAIAITAAFWVPPAWHACDEELQRNRLVAYGQTCVENKAVSQDNELFHLCFERTRGAELTLPICLHGKLAKKFLDMFPFSRSDEPQSFLDVVFVRVFVVGVVLAFKADSLAAVILNYLNPSSHCHDHSAFFRLTEKA
jgi:hypothetical protein